MIIALLEDDSDQSALLSAWLEDAGNKCVVFNSGKEITKSLLGESYDLLILDWLGPDRTLKPLKSGALKFFIVALAANCI